MVAPANQPVPETYNAVPFYDPNVVSAPFFNSANHVRYKVGSEYYVYDVRKSTPALISIHALISRFERFLQGHG